MNLRWRIPFGLARPAHLTVGTDRLLLSREGEAEVLVDLPADATVPPWEDLLQTLGRRAGMPRSTEVTVHAAHARLFVLPSAPTLDTETRWQTYARSRFEALHGESAEAWWLQLVPERPGRPRLAVALPRVLVQALRAGPLGAVRGIRIDALLRLDALRQRERRYSGAVVDLGAQHALLAMFDRGVLQRVRLRRLGAGTDDLACTLRSEWAALERDDDLPALAIGPAAAWHAAAVQALRPLAPRVLDLS